MRLKIVSSDPDLIPTKYYYFYFKNDYTNMVGNVIYPNITFSGDYIQEYQEQETTNTIINNNNDNTEEIIAAINGLVDTNYSGDPSSGDIYNIDIEDPTEDFFTWFYREFVRVLNNNNNVNLTLPIWKTNYTIPSNIFVLDIEPLRSFISLGWWVIVGVPFLKFIRRTIEKVKGGNVPVADEKSDLLGNIM